jgi:hypothetical protein
MRVYIAGPMTGLPESNYPAFRAEAARLRALGHEVVSPNELNAGREHEGWTACMKRDIAVLTTCDAVQVLNGWMKSRGAKLEIAVARELGITVYSPHLPLRVPHIEGIPA